MAHPLDNVFEKLERANEHIKQLQIETEALIDLAPYRTIPEGDPHALQEFKQMLGGIVIPPRISILAGEAIHQTRSALDHVAATLVATNAGCVVLETQFPIYIYRPACEKDSLRYEGHIRGMPRTAKALIDGLQPFNAGVRRHNHPLALLKRLNNRDKHHALLMAVAACRRRMRLHWDDDSTFDMLASNDTDALTDAIDMKVERTFSAFVVFPEFDSTVDEPIVESVARLWSYVKFGLMRQFRDCF